ncbi:MAG: glycosyl hydrolase family 32 [Clostridiales bacterium]|nr:glycosyl hydrolase family 32 [Clostridiales bacterium]
MEQLYNGITLPETWPPNNRSIDDAEKMKIPYLEKKPEVICIDRGRQLFVDDFLIAETDLRTVYHQAVKYEGNPVFTAQTEFENEVLPCACPKSGGVWFDKFDGKYKMWYEAGWLNKLAYAESDDGLHWVRPSLDVVPGTNLILPGVVCDSSTVFIDYDTTNVNERYKLFMREPGGLKPGLAYTSPDGIHWSEPTRTEPIHDRSTMFYNPFRKKWVYSIRFHRTDHPAGRVRYYRECDDYIKGANWSEDEAVFWMRVDQEDLPDPVIGVSPELYNFDAVAYESIMLGMFQIWRGPQNKVCAQGGYPKITELVAAYSRDGFHFHRPDREPFISASRKKESWDRGYVQSVGGLCLVKDDELWFYYIGFQGDENNKNPVGKLNGMHAKASTGIAKLRRDGFASLSGTGNMMTEKMICHGKKYLFVNANSIKGQILVEVLDENEQCLAGFSASECIPIIADKTKMVVQWQTGNDLSFLDGIPFKLRFHLKESDLYAFWLSDDIGGSSNGFDAAGSPS